MICRGTVGGREGGDFIHEGLATQLSVAVFFREVFVFGMGEGGYIDVTGSTETWGWVGWIGAKVGR